MSDVIRNATSASGIHLHIDAVTVKKLTTSLSAIEQVGNSVWLAGDESKSLARLTLSQGVDYDKQANFPLGDFFPALQRKINQEMDLEALSWDEDTSRLWFVGSHSLHRKDIEEENSAPIDAVFRALGKINRQENRYVLGSVQLGEGAAGPHTEPIAASAAAIPFDKDTSSLIELLRKNAALAPFLEIPSKENGFDIEGLAVGQGRLFLGLRGPVIRGLASVLEFRIVDGKDVVLNADDAGVSPYRHHLLDLAGLGVRDLCVQGNDLLVLAGPTMKLDGPIRVYRWAGALGGEAKPLTCLFGIAVGEGTDHAEGIALFRQDAQTRLIVVYDSPGDVRLNSGEFYTADLFDLETPST
ncbi:hypothetical protein AWB67_01295 [Caballeronia terrestris]|uniref:DUF3616 domain-containing protein n=1 Tax=Caballeronia terrestris TaxID=1226301 RepID=A0A158GG06_9BURK|nr:DUF3616 domain-containing protein [Caballeronia terrestris]SAL30976.1 hypothetical protein AWB67_01295 [Caballeronia terrestris]